MYRKTLVPLALDHRVSVRADRDEDTVKKAFGPAHHEPQEKVQEFQGVSTEIVSGHTARAIIDHANANTIDCIVNGASKPGLSDYLRGSTASYVIRHAYTSTSVLKPTKALIGATQERQSQDEHPQKDRG